MRPLVLGFAIAACSSSDTPPGDDAPPVEECQPADDTIDLDLDHGWALDAMAADERGAWVVLEKKRDNVSSFVIADRTGEVATLVDGIANTFDLSIAPVVVGGKRCIAMHVFDEVLRFACEDGTLELPGLEIEGRLSAVEGKNGAVHVFGQDFAAYHELRRQSGAWGEVEKFESSVSTAQDAVKFSGDAVSCFLSTDDLPSIDRGGDVVYGTDIARWCRLIGGSELGVLTDLGLTTFSPGEVLGGWQPTGIDVRPAAVGRRDGEPFAVVHREDRIELQPLPTGTPTTLRTLEGSENAHAAIDGKRIFVTTVKPIFETGATRYQLVSSTRCME